MPELYPVVLQKTKPMAVGGIGMISTANCESLETYTSFYALQRYTQKL